MLSGMRRIALAVVPLAVLALAACAPSPISDAEFVKQASVLETYGDLSNAQLAGFAQSLCESFETYDSKKDRTYFANMYAAQMQDSGTSTETAARQFAQLAVDRYCPDLAID